MFTGIDKLLAGVIGPFVAKLLLWVTTTLGMAPLGSEAQMGVTALVVGALVFFIPNKAKT